MGLFDREGGFGNFIENIATGVQDKFSGVTPQERFVRELKALQEEQARREREQDVAFRESSHADQQAFRESSLDLMGERNERMRETAESNLAFREEEARRRAAQREAEEFQRVQDELKADAQRAEDIAETRNLQEDRQAHAIALAERKDRDDPDGEQERQRFELLKEFTDSTTGVDEEGYKKALELAGLTPGAEPDAIQGAEAEKIFAAARAEIAKRTQEDPNVSEAERGEAAIDEINAQADGERQLRERGGGLTLQRQDDVGVVHGGEEGAPNEGPPTMGLEIQRTTQAADDAQAERDAMAEFTQAVRAAAAGEEGEALQGLLANNWAAIEQENPEFVARARQIYEETLKSKAPF
jgi:hypothetical protein